MRCYEWVAKAAATAGTSARSVPVLRLCPPASFPCMMTASTPLQTASRASGSASTCIHTFTPAPCGRRRERLRGIVQEVADYRNPLLTTEIQLRLLGGLQHGNRCRTRAE